MANKKILSVLSTAAIGSVLAAAVGTTAIAKVDGLVVKNAEGTYMNYDLEALKESVIEDALGNEEGAVLYNGFDADRANGELVSYHDDATGFVDADAVQNAAIDAALNGGEFDLNTFTESAEETALPETVYQAELEDGQVVAGEEVAPEEATDELKVESVSAIDAKTLGVKLGKEPTAEEKANLTFAVKNGDSTVLTKVASWDGATAKLTRTSGVVYDAGDYTVTVTGLPEGANATATVTLEEQTASTIDLTTTVVNDNTDKSKLAVVFQDQYGTDLTLVSSDFTVTAYNKTQATAVTSKVKFDSTDKYFYFDTDDSANDFEADDVVSLTIMHNATGLKFTKELTVGQEAFVDSIAFGEIELPTGKTILTSDLTNVKVSYTAEDQYGNDITLSGSNVSLVSSDSAVLSTGDVSFTTDSDGNKLINVAKFLKEGKATLTVLGLASGNTATVTFDVQQAAGSVASVSVAEANKTIAAGSTAYVDLTVTDKYGDAVEAKDYIGEINITSSNPTVVVNGDANKLKVEETTGDDYGKLKVTVESGAAKDATTVLTLTDATTGKQYATVNVKAGEVAKASAIDISVDSEHKTSLLKGATTDIVFSTKDQYGNDWTATGDYQVDFVIKDSSDVISVSPSSDVNESAATTTVTAEKAGSAVLQAKLMKGAEVIDVEEVTLTVAENDSTAYTYEINDIPTLFQNTNVDTDDASGVENTELSNKVDLGYAKEVAVTAKDGNGSAFELPSNAIVNMTIDGAGKDIVVQKETSSGKWYVVTDDNSETEDWTATLSVVINADDTVKTLTKEITVSKDAPVAQSIAIKDLDYDDANADDAKDVDEYTVANAAGYESADQSGAQDVYVWVKDQFGGYGLSSSADLNLAAVSGISGIAGDTVTIGSGAVNVTDTSSDIVFTEDDATFRIIATSGAQTDFITVTVTDGVLPVADTTTPVAIDLNGTTVTSHKLVAGAKISFKFSEVLTDDATKEAALKAAIVSAVDTAFTTTTGVTVTTTDHQTYIATVAASKELDTTGDVTVSVDATKVYDAALNQAGASGTIDFDVEEQ